MCCFTGLVLTAGYPWALWSGLCSLQPEVITDQSARLLFNVAKCSSQCYANSYFGMAIRFRCWRNKTVELVQAARKARSKERREHGSVQRAPTWDLLLLPLADGCLYWLWPCGLRDPVLTLGLPTCSVPGGDGASVVWCSLLCVVIYSLPNGQSLVLQACSWSGCVSCLTVYTAYYCVLVPTDTCSDETTGLGKSIEQNDGHGIA